MALKISANSAFTHRYLKLRSWGVTFRETAAFGGVHKFPFSQIEYILMSPKAVLSFQVGQEVFSIPTKPKKKKHIETIEALLREVSRAAGR
ncbi:MAG: hypothetical protein JW889_10705 [Verrucomicrobia bacterium]|nr:hypothetical protein [Verrucomicrobiota bacterium]